MGVVDSMRVFGRINFRSKVDLDFPKEQDVNKNLDILILTNNASTSIPL